MITASGFVIIIQNRQILLTETNTPLLRISSDNTSTIVLEFLFSTIQRYRIDIFFRWWLLRPMKAKPSFRVKTFGMISHDHLSVWFACICTYMMFFNSNLDDTKLYLWNIASGSFFHPLDPNSAYSSVESRLLIASASLKKRYYRLLHGN